MDEKTDAAENTAITEQAAAIDMTAVTLSFVVAAIAIVLLLWHIQQVKKRPATSHDKMTGGIWAAVAVLAIARAVSLLI